MVKILRRRKIEKERDSFEDDLEIERGKERESPENIFRGEMDHFHSGKKFKAAVMYSKYVQESNVE